MKPFIIIIIISLLPLHGMAGNVVPDDYVWTTPSRNSSESMPCGGHDVGMNVWVENGDVLFYVSRSGMFDENNTLLKAGRFRLHLSSQPFGGEHFRQTLRLADGAVYIQGRDTEIRLWADVYTSAVYATIRSSHKTDATLSYESWRYKDRPVSKGECQQCSYKWVLPKDCTTFADSIRPGADALEFWHQNRQETVFDFTVSRQRLDQLKPQLYNPIGGLKFGGIMKTSQFTFAGTSEGVYASTDYRAWHYQGRGITKATISIALYEGNAQPRLPSAKVSAKRSADWWKSFWQRSHVVVSAFGADSAAVSAITRNYALFRYMLGCNAYGQWPTKFNGSLFTFDPVYVDEKTPYTPDYRRWGGGTMTAQNQRLVYWPMLKTGDIDMMKAQFDTYLRMLPTAVARTRHYWGHDGASFTEQIENFGLPNPAEYGKHKEGDDFGMERNAWLEYQWDTALEFCAMILQAHQYAGTDITAYLPMVEQCLRFFDEHYQYLARQRGVKPLDGDGHLIFYPSSGCETYKMAYNSASVIAALSTVTAAYTQYLEQQQPTDTTAIAWLKALSGRIPPLPMRTIDGHTCIAPAMVWARIQNVETPQLYPVFPWRVYGMGRPNLDIARNTYLNDPHALSMRTSKGWKQDNIWAACLGITDDARQLTIEKFADGPYRFPAFWDPGYDWAPDCNRGGSAMIGLHEMLLQEDATGQLLLFPTWPKGWDARFRLHATGGRVVEAEIREGKVTTIQQ